MSYSSIDIKHKVHRIVPSRFPPVQFFDWAENKEELEQIAALEGLTNDRLLTEYGDLNIVAREDWVSGRGATALMSAFTHIGHASRFCDASFGIYYAADSQKTAIKETVFHRERFYRASNEPACKISMREYTARVLKPLIDLRAPEFQHFMQPFPEKYEASQAFGRKLKDEKQWGLYYPSVRNRDSFCVAIFRPPALSLPLQAAHFEYLWDGERIAEIIKKQVLK